MPSKISVSRHGIFGMIERACYKEYGEIALAKGAAGYIEKGETSKLVEVMRRATLRL